MSIRDLIVLRGRAGTDVILHRSEPDEDGEEPRVFCRFRMAVSRSRRKDNGEWEDAPALWYTVKAWGRLAENTYYSVRRGMPILVVGRPSAQAWIGKDGALQSEIAINANSIGHDLTFGLASFSRATAPKRAGEDAQADRADEGRGDEDTAIDDAATAASGLGDSGLGDSGDDLHAVGGIEVEEDAEDALDTSTQLASA